MDDCGGGGQCCCRLVVVGDDEADVEFFREFGGIVGVNAAVNGDEEFGSVFCEESDGVGVEAVAFVDSVRDVEVGIGAEEAEKMPEDCGACDAVDVVIAIDGYFLFFFDCAEDYGQCVLDAGHFFRPDEVCKFWPEELRGFAGV